MPPTFHPAQPKVLDKKLVVHEEIVHIKKPVFEDVIMERPVLKERTYEVPKIVYVEKTIEIPVERIVYKDVVVERPVWKDVVVERVTYKDVIIERPKYEDKIVFVPRAVEREEVKIVPKIVEREQIKYNFVERVVEVPIYHPVHVEKAIIRDSKFVCSRCKVEVSKHE